MNTATYSAVRTLAAYYAGRADDTTGGDLRLPPSESALLLAFIADELIQVWQAEAWPELCNDFEAVSVTDKAFSKREGDNDEMGDILSIYITGSPHTTTLCSPIEDWVEADGEVRVETTEATVYVEYQDPAPDLLAVDSGDLDDYELPLRFKPILALRAAAWLLAEEDPARAEKYRQLANARLAYEAGRVTVPWWRRAVVKK